MYLLSLKMGPQGMVRPKPRPKGPTGEVVIVFKALFCRGEYFPKNLKLFRNQIQKMKNFSEGRNKISIL